MDEKMRKSGGKGAAVRAVHIFAAPCSESRSRGSSVDIRGVNGKSGMKVLAADCEHSSLIHPVNFAMSGKTLCERVCLYA